MFVILSKKRILYSGIEYIIIERKSAVMNSEYDNFKEQVRSAADIVEVISGYVALKKKGRNYWGCCPFHGEKTPSFAVNPDKDMFYCFGCHEGGDVFKFIMKSESCGFAEALKILAVKYGIPVPEREKSAAEVLRDKKTAAVLKANELAGRFFQACLTKTPYGKAPLAYLHGRGITADIVERFSIGYALNKYDALVNSLGKRGCTPELLVEAGLASRGRNFYDKFRNRIMIPIKDLKGRTVGFGGRVLDDGVPKYLNTAQTDWFNKRKLLFGYDIAGREIKNTGTAVVVEGYMDVVSLHAAGITNVVASMGTAFSAEQAAILKKTAPKIIFCYDGDTAGRQAAVRAVSIARKSGAAVFVASIPAGKDPDDYVRTHGKEAFLKVLEKAVEGMNFQIEETILQNNIDDLAGKVRAVSNILPFLLECESRIEIGEHIRRLAQRLVIDESLIAAEYRKLSGQSDVRRDVALRYPKVAPVADRDRAGGVLLAILLKDGGLLEFCKGEQLYFPNAVHQRIYDAMLSCFYESEKDIPRLRELLDEAAVSVLAEISVRDPAVADPKQTMLDCLRQLKKLHLETEYEKHRLLAVEYERRNDPRFLNELSESQRIKNEIKNLYG